MDIVFNQIYEWKSWGDNNNPEYNGSSGQGSTYEYNKDSYIPFLKDFIKTNNIKDVVDLGCGDFICGNHIYGDLDVSYTGYDTYKKIIDHHQKRYDSSKYTFIHLDFYNHKEQIKNGDLCILKDVIQHWSLFHIYSFLDYIIENKKFKYILICNCCHQHADNEEIMDGGFRCLSCDFLPLKKYNFQKIYNYDTKEVSFLKIDL